jgi:hypothetical protein
MRHLSRRERRELAALGRQLAEQAPELAEQLSRPPMPATELWARRIGSAMFVVGVVLLGAGILFSAPGAGTFGAVLLPCCWMPWRIVAKDP